MATWFESVKVGVFLATSLSLMPKAKAQEGHQRPMRNEIRAECINGMLVVIEDLGFGPMCGGWRNSLKLHTLKFDAPSNVIEMELSENNEGWGPHPERCHAWGETRRSFAVPNLQTEFYDKEGQEVRQWKVVVNGAMLNGEFNLSHQWDPESQKSKPICTRM